MNVRTISIKILRIPAKLLYYFYIVWNRVLFSLNGVEYGSNMKVFNRFYLRLHPTAKVRIGDNFTFSSGGAHNPLCRVQRGMIYLSRNARLTIGDNSGLSSACIWVKDSVTIGNNVNVGGDCIILDNDCHSLDFRDRSSKQLTDNGDSLDYSLAKSSPVVIEDDVLVGARCIILKGVTIGARSIIAAGSVVTKSIPSDCIAGGNPCRVIRQLLETNKQ